MAYEFQQKLLPYLRMVNCEDKNCEVTGELRIAEEASDIGRVLGSWGQVMIRGKEWRGSGIGVSGGILVWVLYEPEGGGQPCCADLWVPFQLKWDFTQNENDGYICALPMLCGLEARAASARKLVVRACVGMSVKVMVRDSLELWEPPETIKGVEILNNTYPLTMLSESGEKAFSIEEKISIPGSYPRIGKIVYYRINPCLTETKLMGDKLIFRGTGKMHILYCDTDGMIQTWDTEIPISQYAQLDGEYSDSSEVDLNLVITNVETNKDENGDYTWNIGMTGQYIISKTVMINIAEDAYIPGCGCGVEVAEIRLPSVLERKELNKDISCRFSFEGNQMIDAASYMDCPQIFMCDSGLQVQFRGKIHALGYSSDGALVSECSTWEETEELPADESVRAVVCNMNCACSEHDEFDTMSVNDQVSVQLYLINQNAVSAIKRIESREKIDRDSDRPSLIIKRSDDTSLWEVAKKIGTTVGAIKKANHLDGDPLPGQLLLIPVP